MLGGNYERKLNIPSKQSTATTGGQRGVAVTAVTPISTRKLPNAVHLPFRHYESIGRTKQVCGDRVERGPVSRLGPGERLGCRIPAAAPVASP